MSKAVVLEMLNRFNCSKVTGFNNIPARFLRDATEIINPCITHIVNLSIEQGLFPSDLKLVRVIPLYTRKEIITESIVLFQYCIL